MDKRVVSIRMKQFEENISQKIQRCLQEPTQCIYNAKKYFNIQEKRSQKVTYTGKILHLDGDKRYSDKSIKYYKSLGLNAIVKNIPESRQAGVVINLLEKYNPDILVITRS